MGSVDNGLTAFNRNSTTGAISFNETEINGTGGIEGLSVAQNVIVSPDNQNAYVTDSFNGNLAVFQRDNITNKMRFLEVHSDNQGGADGLSGATGIAMSTDGKFLYIASEFDDGVAVFSRGTSGALTFIEAEFDGIGGVTGLDGAIAVALSPDDKYVYVASTRDDALVVFSRDTTTGQLTFLEFH